MTRRASVLALLPLILAALGATRATAGAPRVIQDPDYQFRLVVPGPRWQLLPERKIKALVPDAVAGARTTSGVLAAVIVEHAPGLKLPTYADLVIDNMPIEHKKVEVREETTFQGLPAITAQVRGKIREIDARYFLTFFLRDGFAYQLVGIGPSAVMRYDGSTFRAFRNAFSLTDGKVQAREENVEAQSADGVGWRLRGRTFESAAYGLHVVAPNGWRPVVGDELANMGDGAEIGMVSKIPEAFFIVVPERLAGVDRAQINARVVSEMAENTQGRVEPEPLAIPIAGESVTFRRVVAGGDLPFEYLVGLRWRDDMSFKVIAWHAKALRVEATPALERALTSIHFLDEPRRKALEASLEKGPDPQNEVGPMFSLRRGRYQDFRYGISWHKPEGYWRMRVGQAARAFHPDATLALEEPAFGLFGMVINENVVSDFDHDAYHGLVVRGIWDAEEDAKATQSETLELNGNKVLVTRGLTTAGNDRFYYVAATVVHGTVATQILFWGYPGNMRRSLERVRTAIKAFSMPKAGLAPSRKVGSQWFDNRLGFALQSPSSSWAFRDNTPTALRPVATMLQLRKGADSVIALAICALQPEQDPEAMIELVTSTIRPSIGRHLQGKPQRSTVTFEGHAATRLAWRGRTDVDVVLFPRDRTLYGLVYSTGARSDRLSLTAIDDLFQLID